MKRKLNLIPRLRYLFFSSILAVLASPTLVFSKDFSHRIKYRTNFGYCPSRAVGRLVLDLVKVFEEKNSLRSLKSKILDGKLDKKHFISKYAVSYDPLRGQLNFSFECPKPLMKVQLYRDEDVGPYEAILVENGKLYDAAYEDVLRSEKKLDHDLVHLAIPVGEMDENAQVKITDLVLSVGADFRRNISEVILAEDGNLTIILSILGHPSSVFIGNNEWPEKVTKLRRLVDYVKKKQKVPAIINLVNSKKVVVKFNDRS